MDVFDIRAANLRALLAELSARGITKNSDTSQALGGLGDSFLSQLKGGKRMGEKIARKIEQATRKPIGWMDLPHDELTSIPGDNTNKARHLISDVDAPIYSHPLITARDLALLRHFHAASESAKRIIEAAASAAAREA